MTFSAKQISDHASFSAFLNAYSKEVDSGVWHSAKNWQSKTGLIFGDKTPFVLELQLTNAETTLAIGASFRSLIGRHCFTEIFQQKKNQWTWQRLDSLSAIFLLIDNIFNRPQKSSSPATSDSTQETAAAPLAPEVIQPNSHKMELMSRIIESHQTMREYVEKRGEQDSLAQCAFIESEQSLLYGHWLHPTPKSRQGIHWWQHEKYTPELAGKFQLHFFAVQRELIEQDSTVEYSAAEIIDTIALHRNDAGTLRSLAGLDTKEKQLVPTHPLQAQWLLNQDDIKQLISAGKITDLGLLGPEFSPTSSVRTLYCASLDFMVKLSIPVKITNSLRVNKHHELSAGLLVGKYLDKTPFFSKHAQFKFIKDPAYISVKIPGKTESGFETILRENPFTPSNRATDSTLSIAALVQDPIKPGSQSRLGHIIKLLASKEKVTLIEASTRWFEKYWHAAIEPAIHLYDSTGVAIESHQQNALLELGDGYPLMAYYRDNQGFYLSQSLKSKILRVEPKLADKADLFYDDTMICDRFGYYLIVNQLFSVINRFAIDQLISEQALLKLAQTKLERLALDLNGVGKVFVNRLLEQKQIPCKGNLLTRVHDLDELQVENELAVYTKIQNPFYLTRLLEKSKKSVRHQEVYRETA